ncbi:MAG: GNAT family N-acetyltransferase [Anaerolineales bacterium]|nr:GNAT family N-acetyltransferase [Anaerolineales bacterium]
MTSAEIKQMRSAEIEEAAEVLSHAMHRNPIHVAVYQGESENERQQIEDAFSDLLRDRPEEVIMAKQGSQIIGVCRSLVCRGDRFISPEVQELLDTRYPELSSFQDRHNYWVGIWASCDPSILHRHLGPIGVLPEYQNLGVGTQLMERYCKLVDEHKLPAYLETDTLTNVSFYRKFGFNIIDEFEILEVMNYFMWRDIQE